MMKLKMAANKVDSYRIIKYMKMPATIKTRLRGGEGFSWRIYGQNSRIVFLRPKKLQCLLERALRQFIDFKTPLVCISIQNNLFHLLCPFLVLLRTYERIKKYWLLQNLGCIWCLCNSQFVFGNPYSQMWFLFAAHYCKSNFLKYL